jgi:hypothetical protein
VRAAVAAIGYTPDIPRLPPSFEAPEMRKLDVLDLLQFVFGFQVINFSLNLIAYCHLLELKCKFLRTCSEVRSLAYIHLPAKTKILFLRNSVFAWTHVLDYLNKNHYKKNPVRSL